MTTNGSSRGRDDSRLRLFILGSAAGGGYPQWNCACDVCSLFWAGDPRVKARGQSSIAATADGQSWLLLNASPDIRAQIMVSEPFSPFSSNDLSRKRHSPISAVLVTNGDVDHVAGLLTLREKQSFALYATAGVHEIIAANPIFGVVDPALVPRLSISAGETFEPVPGLKVEVFAVPGKVPLYLESGDVEVGGEGDMTVGVRLSAHGRTAYYIPGCAHLPDHLLKRIAGADVLFFDGTVFHDDEMATAGVGAKTGRRMGHMPIAGEDGSLNAFDGAGIGRRVYIHINNTNPILVEGSHERRAAEAAGWRIGEDGMEILA